MRSLRLHAKATRTCTNLVVVSLRKLHTPTTLVSHRLNAPSSPYIRRRGSSDLVPGGVKDDFVLWPNFFDFDQTKQLTIAALWKLDRSDSTRRRTRRPSESSRLGGNIELTAGSWAPLAAVFCGEYGFEKGHYDTVIHGYREVLMSNLPPPSHLYPDLVPLLDTVYALLPSSPQIQGDVLPRGALTHLLHLAPEGEILPHVDNLEASGSVILGVCLGASRMLRLRKKADPNTANQWDLEDGWDILLPNGAVYLQRDRVRYDYEHSILPYTDPGSTWDGTALEFGHRISIMIRDAPSSPAQQSYD